MPPLPPELLGKIFSELTKRDLTSIALTSRLYYHLSLVPLYQKILNIQLFGWSEQARLPSLKCLESLSLPGHGPQAVRHFSARGHPWLPEVTTDTLLRALLQMKNLVSLELDLGAPPEELVFTESQCSEGSFLPHLRAISLYHHKSAVHLLKDRPVENARIKSNMDVAAFLELLPALGSCSTSLTSLQVRISVPDVASVVTITESLTRELPSLRILGIALTFPTPNWTERLSMAVKEITNPLSRMKNVIELGLAMIPDLQSLKCANSNRSDLETCFDVVRQHMPLLRIIEVQWEACELRDERLELLSKHHSLMRRVWRYSYTN